MRIPIEARKEYETNFLKDFLLLLCFIYSRRTAYILRNFVPKHILGKLYGRDNRRRQKDDTDNVRTMLE